MPRGFVGASDFLLLERGLDVSMIVVYWGPGGIGGMGGEDGFG
jgi:hypothetical protein